MKKTQTGLTLIEVLIALAMVSIAMTAIIKATTQNIHSTAYLQKKTVALWVAQDVINEIHGKLLNIRNISGNQRLTTDMLGKDWYWQMEEQETPNAHIKKMIVRVYDNDNVINTTPVVTLTSYSHEE